MDWPSKTSLYLVLNTLGLKAACCMLTCVTFEWREGQLPKQVSCSITKCIRQSMHNTRISATQSLVLINQVGNVLGVKSIRLFSPQHFLLCVAFSSCCLWADDQCQGQLNSVKTKSHITFSPSAQSEQLMLKLCLTNKYSWAFSLALVLYQLNPLLWHLWVKLSVYSALQWTISMFKVCGASQGVTLLSM